MRFVKNKDGFLETAADADAAPAAPAASKDVSWITPVVLGSLVAVGCFIFWKRGRGGARHQTHY